MFGFRRDRRQPSGITVSPEFGDKLKDLSWGFGVEARQVLFADHRSGWCGVNITLRFFVWSLKFCVLRWRFVFKPQPRVLSLREQIQRDHGHRPRQEDDSV